MGVTRNSSRLSPSYLDKILHIHQNLSNPTPNLWNQNHKTLNSDLPKPPPKISTLTLSHPILRTLESLTPTLNHFNQTHAQLIVSGLFQHPFAAGRAIKKLCSAPLNSSLISHAVFLFEYLDEPDAFVCNTIVKAYVSVGDLNRAVRVYHKGLIEKCVEMNNFTYPVLFKVFGEMRLGLEGEKVHGRILKFGFGGDVYVRNTMIYFYSSVGRIACARKVFDESCNLDIVTWNSMVDGYVKNGDVGMARVVFERMPERDVVSWNCMINGYISVGDIDNGVDIFGRMGVRDVVSWNSMVEVCARIGNVKAAQEFFKRIPQRNLTSWNIMLALIVRTKDFKECLRMFDEMINEGEVKPDEATLVSILISCGSLSELDRGKWVHSYIKKNSQIVPDVLLLTNLLTMYAKCGAMNLAKEVFDEMTETNVVSWNSMISGYGTHGHSAKALQMFFEMEKRGVLPNDTTFICILSACTHGGMVLEGCRYFFLMERVYKIKPKVEHYGCMVDLLGRAGLMKDSEELIKKMSMEAGPALWGALLSACRIHRNFEPAKILGERLIAANGMDVGPYVTLSNIYAMEGNWDEVEKVRFIIKEKRLQKAAGSSLVAGSTL